MKGDIDRAFAALTAAGCPAWLVGGALRDRLLGRVTSDYDVVVHGDVPALARSVARAADGHVFELSEGFGAWRVLERGGGWQLDLLPVAGGSIEYDLAQRDLTVNAMAERMSNGDLIDPFGGLADLRERRLRMVSPQAFTRDPLRALRLVRLATELEFEVESGTASEARRQASGLARVSPERVFEELKRIVCSTDPISGLGLMDDLGVTAVILPELWSLRGIEQSRFHHLDVHAHTLSVVAETVALERAPAEHLGADGERASEFLGAPLANGLTRWQALRFAALLHDIAKPQTRDITPEGRVTFIGHDATGARQAADILSRLRTSEKLRDHVAALVRHHLRLGFLVHEMPLDRRAIYRYLRDTAPVGVDVTVLSVADRLSTRGERSHEAIAKHLDLAGQMLGEALCWSAQPPRPPVRGNVLSRELGLAPGPQLGEVLAELEEAAFAHEISSTEEAIRRARELLGTPPGSGADR